MRLASDLMLITNGYSLQIISTGDLVAEKGSQVWSYDFDQENARALQRRSPNDDPFGFVPDFDTGPGTNGNPNGPGRNGYDARPPGYLGHGSPGRAGFDAGLIDIFVQGTATGELIVINDGIPGSKGQEGLAGRPGGDGQQGRVGQPDSLGICAVPPDSGGNGGRGGNGHNGGSGGSGGNGGRINVRAEGVASSLVVVGSVLPAAGGVPGLPGTGTRGHRQGCGGEGGPCTKKVWTYQGFRGAPGRSGSIGSVGANGKPGNSAIVAPIQIKNINAESCVPFDAPDGLDPAEFDSLQQFSIFGATAGSIFGTAPRQITSDGGVPLQIVDLVAPPAWLGLIDRSAVIAYARNGENFPLPSPPMAGCRNADCCKPEPWIGCLQRSLWDFDAQSPKKRYLDSRQPWLQQLKKLLAIEIARSSVLVSEDQLVSDQAVTQPRTYLQWFPQTPSNKQSLLTNLDAELFARIAYLLGNLIPEINIVLHLPTDPNDSLLMCQANRIQAISSSTNPASLNFSNFIAGPIKPISIYSPAPTSQYFGLPISYHGDTLIFGTPSVGASKMDVAGYQNIAFCQMGQKMSHSSFSRPMACEPKDQNLNDLISGAGRDIDFPGVISIIFSTKYIEAIAALIPIDLENYASSLIHCPPSVLDRD